jgi:hypothetical protein
MADPGTATRALDLLLAEAGRERTGEVRDSTVWAAVVGVERVALVEGTTDPGRLRLLLQEDGLEAQRARTRVEEALERASADRGPDSGTAHREAGHHSVTTDAVRLRAALRAAHRTFEHEPYYRARYADRGARYAGTDSAWLVTLADLPADGCRGQVAWLSRVLAGRGMPSWLLERHLRDLVVELERAAGPGAGGSLPDAADHLAAARRAVVDDDALAAAAGELRAATGEAEPLPGAAALALAAAADVVTGTVAGYDACVDWLTDPERCTPAAATWLRERAAGIAPRPDLSAGTSRGGSPAPRS